MQRNCEKLETRVMLSSWYVSAASGSPSNPGTLIQPFGTIQQAANVAQPGDVVFIRGGTYRETVLPAHSGTPGHPITYQPYPGEKVTMDGADIVNSWSAYQGSIYQTLMPWDLGDGKNQVFYDGQMMTEARWPNTGLDLNHPFLASSSSAAPQVNNTGPSVATIGVPSLQDPAGTWAGATIHISAGQGWVTQTGTVIASSPGSLTFTYQSLSSFQVPSPGDHFYLTGKFQTLDSPDEWYRDNTGKLYYWAPGNANPSTHQVEVKRRLYAFDLSGTSNIDITGLNLMACTINTDAASTDNTIDGISALYVSQNWINPNPWDAKNHPHTSGIILNGVGNVLQNSRIQYSSGDGVFLGGSGNTVRNCLISDVDYAAGDEAGVTAIGINEQITGNTIYNAGRSGVVFRLAPDVRILHNVVHDFGLQTTDLGGLYTYGTDGKGTEIAYNLVYNGHSGGYGADGIYLDNFTGNYVVHHNVVWNCDYAIKLNPPSNYNLIYNNTFSSTSYAVMSSGTEDMTGTAFANNIFTTPTQIGPGATQSHNLASSTDPQFVSPSTGNLQLLPTSPAIDAGLPLVYTNGYVGAAPDLGALEYGLPTFAAGSSLASTASTAAAFVASDSSTQGNWTGAYGSDGYGLLGSSLNYPSYAQVTPSGQKSFTWANPSADPRALQAVGSSSRVAACNYAAGSFSLDVNLADGQTHQVALYLLDWDSNSRAENVQITDAVSGAVLDDRVVSSFHGGQWITWNLSGHVKITISSTGTGNAVASALMFDPVSLPAALRAPTEPSALTAIAASPVQVAINWTGSLGPASGYRLERSTDGVNFTDIAANLPTLNYTDNSVLPSTQYVYRVRAENNGAFSGYSNLQSVTTPSLPPVPAAPTGVMVTATNVSSVSLTWTASAGAAGYQVLRRGPGDTSFIAVGTSATTSFTDSSAQPGVRYLYAVLASNLGGNSVASVYVAATTPSGVIAPSAPLNLAATANSFSQVTLTWSASTGTVTAYHLERTTDGINYTDIAPAIPATSLSYTDATVQGNTTYTYRLRAENFGRFSGYSNVTPVATPVAPPPTPGSLQVASATSSAVRLSWTASAGATQYSVLRLGPGDSSFIQIGASTATGFTDTSVLPGATYLYEVLASNLAGNSPASAAATITTPSAPAPPATASFLRTDATTQGNWGGVYGADGSWVFNASQSLPAYAQVTTSAAPAYTWTASTVDARALQTSAGSASRIAASLYSTSSFSFDINLTDGLSHQVALYLLDWDTAGRTQTVQVSDASSGTLLDSRAVSGFHGGQWLTWNLSGHVTISLAHTGGLNAVASGLMFDTPGHAPMPAGAATFVRSDSLTQGSWVGTYGADGYSIFNSTTALPAYAQVIASNPQNYTWASSTSDVRATEAAIGPITRIATTLYSGSNFTLDVNLTDGRAHQVALYMLDWDTTGRAQTVQVTDAATGAMLSTQSVYGFHNGQWLVWNMTGHVKITIIANSGLNAVASAVMFGPAT